ncbi:MAG: hypothetical protein KVP17_000149, partial [Porospora cf. gigantea B]|uniref:uncharacterized protein n=1 Tax=Porospora cf. gigantea B TaxID=2853592 RepID=UPI003571E923
KEKLHDFERVLQQESHQRLSKREVEQKKLQAFQDALDCFEDRINEEMAARSRTVKELVLDVERQLSAFKHELVALLDEQKVRMQEPAERIQNRLVLLERETEKVDVSSLKTELVRDVQAQIKDLRTRLAGIVEDGASVGEKFDMRVKRFENDMTSGLAREKKTIDAQIAAFSCRVERLATRDKEERQEFEQRLDEVRQEMKAALTLESRTREMADNDIVEALNTYTLALQQAVNEFSQVIK